MSAREKYHRPLGTRNIRFWARFAPRFTLSGCSDRLKSMPQAGALPRAQEISSRENRWLKRFRASLRGEKEQAGGVLGIEGAKFVADALHCGASIEAILFSPSGERHLHALSVAPDSSLQLLKTSDRLFAQVSGTQTSQGIAALIHPREYAFDDLLQGAAPIVVVLVGVQDPGNVGTVIRSAEAFGASGVIVTRGTAHPYAPKALRASAGAALRMPLLAGLAPAVALAQLRVVGLRTYAASLAGGADPAATDLRGACALLIGNEGSGLPPEIERSADAGIRIPIAEGVDSLNAAMAAAILLYEAARQRKT
jgi:TrmH family RNA methyltransferase